MLTRKAPDHMGVGVNQCLPHFTLRSLLSCIMNDTHVVRLPLLMIVTIHGVSLKKPSGVRYLEHSRFVYQKCVLWVQRSLPRSTQRARRLTVLTLAFTANPMMGCFYVTRQHCDWRIGFTIVWTYAQRDFRGQLTLRKTTFPYHISQDCGSYYHRGQRQQHLYIFLDNGSQNICRTSATLSCLSTLNAKEILTQKSGHTASVS